MSRSNPVPFLDLPPRRPRRLLVDHALIWSGVVATLVAFGRASDEITGPANRLDALVLTALFVLNGYLLISLPTIWTQPRSSWLPRLATPLFILLTLAYFYLGFRSYFIQPGVTGQALFGQLFCLVWLACRMV